MDVGSNRLEMGGAMTIDSKLNSTSTNPIQNKAVGGVMLSTLDEINTVTSKGFITDALATRALAQKVGTTDISSIGDGTCTGAISALNSSNESKNLTGLSVWNGMIVHLTKHGKVCTCYITGEQNEVLTAGNKNGFIDIPEGFRPVTFGRIRLEDQEGIPYIFEIGGKSNQEQIGVYYVLGNGTQKTNYYGLLTWVCQ